jgi:hypothetical protein
MGVWSYPLFHSVTPPGKYTFDISLMPPDMYGHWVHSGFFTEYANTEKKRVWTLDDFMTTHCDTHKIYGYMNYTQVSSWLDLCEFISRQNPTITSLEFHFYCSDDELPFYISWSKGNDFIGFHVGSSDSLFYKKISKDDESLLNFDENMYRKNLNVIPFRYQRLDRKTVRNLFMF